MQEIFVPGRLCILGEHSDWGGEYRSANPSVSIGSTIVISTDEGLYSKCSKNRENCLLICAKNLK